jgi:hypothetical protein
MEIRWVFKCLPAFIFYGDFLRRNGGVTFGPFILIRKKYEGDASPAAEGLIEHELTHVRQFYRTCGLNGPRYLFARWRLAYEVEAYKAELRYAPDAAGRFAWCLANRYRLGITESEALKLLAQERTSRA